MVRETHIAGPLRVLVIGAGPATVFAHLPVLAALRDSGEIVLALVCDIQRERAIAARRQFGFLEDSGDADAAVQRQDLDAVYIFGSAQLHFEYGLAALRAGKHLFVEKPIAPSYAQASVMAQAARARGLVAVGGLNRRFFKSFAAIRARAGKTGWRSAEATFHKAEFSHAPPFGACTWLGANGIHALDALIFMMGGLPEQMTSFTQAAGTPEPSSFSALMRWRDGAKAVFLCNNSAGSRREEYVFHGFGETFTVSANALTVEIDGRVESTELPMLGDGFAAEHEAFLRAIHSGVEPLHSIEALAPSLFLAALIEQGFSGQVGLPDPTAMPVIPGVSPDVRPVCAPEQKTILIARSADLQPALANFLAQYRFVGLEDVRASAHHRPDIVAAILGRGSSFLPDDILAKLPKLRVVGVMGLSLARHEPDALLARGVAVLNASAAYAESVAEFALGLAILGRRRAFISHELMRSGGWGTSVRIPGFGGIMERAARSLRPALRTLGLESFFLRIWRAAAPIAGVPEAASAQARDLKGATVGLIGWGANARAFAQRLAGAQARVRVYSEHAAADEVGNSGATVVSLSEALASDVVSLHRGLSNSTRHFLGAAELGKLRQGAVLINIARGALIEPAALIDRLRRGDIFACLDTYEDEPLSASHPLRRLPNVFLTSHIAGGSSDMHAAAAEEVVRKVAAFLAGETVDSISRDRLRTMT